MSETHSNNAAQTIAVEDFSFKEFMQACLAKWKWFVLSLIGFIGLAYLYVATREPVYERSEQILIKNQESGGGIGDMAGGFSTLGLFSSNTSVNNELISITSPAITYEVVKILRLDMNYVKKGGMYGVTLYGSSLPFEMRLLDVGTQEGVSLRCTLNPDGSMVLKKFEKTTLDGKVKLDGEVNVSKLGEVVSTPLGKILLSPNQAYKGRIEEPMDIAVTKLPMQVAVEHYSNQVKGDLVDEYAEVIELVIRDVNVPRAVDILNEIVKVYNQNYIDDKNKIAQATSAFIDERLSVIQKELGEVDHNIADYQSSLGSLNLYAEGRLQTGKDEEYSQKIVALTNQLQMTNYLRDFIANADNKYKILPINTGVDSPEIETQIGVYNELLLERNTLIDQSSAANPIVQDYDNQLTNMRSAIMEGVSNQIKRYTTLLKSAQSEQSKAQGLVRETPGKSLPLISEERQQKVKENLYLYLLEKREENELTQKFTADNTRIITPPMGSLKPVAPKKTIILFGALLLGLGVPLISIYLAETNNTKVRSKKDLEKVKMPFAGEIPQVGKQKLPNTGANSKFGLKKKETAPMSVVEEGKRDVVNEAFRVIRSNLDFMSKKTGEGEVIMLTSFNPGSGKSFISYNLGLSFALKKKKVLLVDCDLRHGSSSMYINMPSKGVTNYLNDSTDDWESLVVKSPVNANLSILPIGKMPPNPAELLENGRLEKLIEMAKKDYDYILLDCPPVNIVVDAQIVGKYVDRTLFIVRAGLLEKSALSELDDFYKDQKFKKMSLILNGTEAIHSRYYTYGTYQNYNK